MADRELNLDDLTSDEWQARVMDAIDLASDQDTATWIIRGGKRIAKIAPVDEIPDAITAWADDVQISASEFTALSMDKRRVLLDRFYARLHEGSSDQSEHAEERS